jgi:hypothetical protein
MINIYPVDQLATGYGPILPKLPDHVGYRSSRPLGTRDDIIHGRPWIIPNVNLNILESNIGCGRLLDPAHDYLQVHLIIAISGVKEINQGEC